VIRRQKELGGPTIRRHSIAHARTHPRRHLRLRRPHR
jgi:hypothetical protein